MGLTGTSLSGEAFDIFEGITYQISGSVNGDAMEFSATGSGGSFAATASMTLDAEGNPLGFSGSWEEGPVQGTACRLN